jgi:hypothetical protein
MTLIAGIFNRKGLPLADSICRDLKQLLSRHDGDQIEVFTEANACFAKLDIGAFGAKGVFQSNDGTISLLTGEPLLGNGGDPLDRYDDLSTVHAGLLADDVSSLRDAHGIFALAHYKPRTASLTLISDKCAVRPLYFWVSEDFVVFASALRILESCALVPKKMDLRGVTEIVALGSALGDRTPYMDIFRLRPAEAIEITKDKVSYKTYWRWDQISPSSEPETARLKAVHQKFNEATNRRMRGDKSTTAFLSGGLDSRIVVASLRQNKVKVHTVNFALAGTQDQAFGDQFAGCVGSIHQSVPREAGDSVPDYSSLMATVLDAWPRDSERQRVVWSGEGGSTSLGFVRFTESIVESMRKSRIGEVVDWFVRDEATQVPVKLFRPRVLENAMEIVRQGVSEELDRFDAADPAWNLYLFLLLNDQAHKLTRHFENLDLHRIEFQLPFFDGGLVEAVLATKLDWLLRHKFYVKLLPYFGPAVTSVPWQAYPGHEPCPLPIPDSLVYQWNDRYQASEHAVKRRRMVARAQRLVKAENFPYGILDRNKLRVAAWLHSTGWRDYQYAIEAAEIYCRYAEISRSGFSQPVS